MHLKISNAIVDNDIIIFIRLLDVLLYKRLFLYDNYNYSSETANINVS